MLFLVTYYYVSLDRGDPLVVFFPTIEKFRLPNFSFFNTLGLSRPLMTVAPPPATYCCVLPMADASVNEKSCTGEVCSTESYLDCCSGCCYLAVLVAVVDGTAVG